MLEVLIKPRELSTEKCYWGYFEKWNSWSKQFPEVSTMPAEESFVILYLLNLLQTGKSYPAIRSSVFAIKYFHKIVGHHGSCNNELVNYVLEGIKRISYQTLNKKTTFYPATTPHIIQINKRRYMNVINLRTMLLCVLSFMQFLRFFEVIDLKKSDINLKETYMFIFIKKKKKKIWSIPRRLLETFI